MFLVYNSDILPEKEFRLPPTDRAFQYGDGLFETIRYENEQVWFWPDHVARLTAGMAALHLGWPTGFSVEAMYQQVQQLLTANTLTHQPARIKVQVWRQPGGLYTPTTNQTNWLITVRPGQAFAVTEKKQVGIYDAFRLTYSPVSAYKTSNALPYILAGLYKQQHGLDDVILLHANTENYLAECQASNLFWFDEDVLYTPALETGCVGGILRQQILRQAEAVEQPVNVGFHHWKSLTFAEAVFCCNVSGIQWLRSIDTIGLFPAGHQQADALFTALR